LQNYCCCYCYCFVFASFLIKTTPALYQSRLDVNQLIHKVYIISFCLKKKQTVVVQDGRQLLEAILLLI